MISVVKIGGNVVDNREALRRFVKEFAALEGPKILVHGGGKEATRLSAALGYETTMIDGRRVTDGNTLEVVTMVYAGLVNKRVVSALQAADCRAIGLSGADASVITATKRPPMEIGDGKVVDFGFVGDIDPTAGVDVNVLRPLLDMGLIPVICAVMSDGHGGLLNCNADSVVSAVATAMAAVEPTRLMFCFEKPGVMADPSDDESVIHHIDKDTFAALKADGVVSGGMIPKVTNALKAVAEGVASVHILSAESILNTSTGTVIS